MLPWGSWEYLIDERRAEVERLVEQNRRTREALLARKSSSASFLARIMLQGKRLLTKIVKPLRVEKGSQVASNEQRLTAIQETRLSDRRNKVEDAPRNVGAARTMRCSGCADRRRVEG